MKKVAVLGKGQSLECLNSLPDVDEYVIANNWGLELNQQFIKIQKPGRVYCTLSYAIIGNDTINKIYRKVLSSRPEAIDLLYIHNIVI